MGDLPKFEKPKEVKNEGLDLSKGLGGLKKVAKEDIKDLSNPDISKNDEKKSSGGGGGGGGGDMMQQSTYFFFL